ncbi:MAG TPA: nucleotide exchange factor GrpE [Flavipsychrobacter sp.]|nr:nucleotide exchange factor GrpE [Flavipsychrobacter sp.]
MIFKKKKNMTDNSIDNQNSTDKNNDNLAENDSMEEALSRELNTDDSISGTQGFELEIEKEEELERVRLELNEQKDKYLRLAAEFDNFKRRVAKERIDLIQTAGRDILQSLLVVLDDCERASKQIESSNDIASLKEGLELVFNKLKNVLQNKGLKKVDSLNQPFDPELHEAITEIPAPSEDMKGKVLDVIEPGYYLNDKLIRHAKVIVGK